MSPKRNDIVCIVGPTATGKSDLAVDLAHVHDGEIVSADSRQVYKGLDIGTGKISPEEQGGVPHYLLDIADPRDRVTVAHYKERAHSAVEDIQSRGKLPFLVGGTGFYIHTVVDNMSLPSVPPDHSLRKELERHSTEELFEKIKEKDPQRAETIDPHNKQRLIRALEIIASVGTVPSVKKNTHYKPLFIGLFLPPDALRARIHERLVRRIEAGMLNEARELYQHSLSYERMEELGLEYRYMARFLKNEIEYDVFIEELEKEIWRYAKRQLTWFRRDTRIQWFQPSETEKIKTVVEHFLRDT